MTAFDQLLLRIKRRDSPAMSLAYDAYKRLMAFDVPDTEAMRILYGGIYTANHVMVDATEWAKSKFLYAPMLRARLWHRVFHGRGGRRVRVVALRRIATPVRRRP